MKVITVIGARPQFVKSAPVSLALKEAGIQEILVHTGQHYDPEMSAIFFEEMGLPKPFVELECGGLSHVQMVAKMLLELESIIVNEKPTYLLVYGDTNSTLAGALVASKLHIPLVHVESGLRSHNLEMPEEMNRILTDRMASILFTPTQQASENLIYEGFERFGCIVENVGDVMYDALLMFKSKGLWRPSMGPVSIFKEPFALATFHRFENVKNPFRLERIVREINDVHENFLPVWLPIHPSTKKILAEHNLELKCYTAPPASYFEMLFALEKCSIVLTDSGGLQKEAYFMQRPCITLRTETEWVELLSVGANTLFDLGKDRGLREKVKSMLLKVIDYSEQFYGDGSAAHKIAHTLAQTKLR